jgi:peptidyl-prolyl cis-trans isomerase A (cyclophilin A)
MRSRSLFVSLSFTAFSTLALGGASIALADEGDPQHGNFTLAEAVKGLPGPAAGPLQAVIETNKGKLTCELFDKQAPVTVANFIGLATGKRAWLDTKSGKWVKKPLYEGLIFHRVIPGFMIQGGDPLGTGMGNPGYRFQDEFSPELTFDKPGQLAMANAGPATNGSQFFITEGLPTYLNGRHTIFGHCEPLAVVTEIANVPKGPADRPVDNVVIKKIVVSHAKPSKATAAKKPEAAKPAAAGDKAAPAVGGDKPAAAKPAAKPAAEKPAGAAGTGG